MNDIARIEDAPKKKGTLITKIANKYDVDPEKMLVTLKSTAFNQGKGKEVTNEQMMALLIVADQYDLNPFIKEIYAFPAGSSITPIVSIDGWLKLINSDPNFDGMEYQDNFDDKGNLLSITCKMFRKDRSHPTEVTEYMSECKRKTSTWEKWPVRMLRHKATIQAARYAFSFAGIYDPDEGERIAENPPEVVYDIGYTDAEKIEFDRLLNSGDNLAYWLFWHDLNDQAKIGLYNSFPHGQKGTLRAQAEKMEADGLDMFQQYQVAMDECIETGDVAGIEQALEEIRTRGKELLVDGLDTQHSMEYHRLMADKE